MTEDSGPAPDSGEVGRLVPWLLIIGLFVRLYHAWAYALNPDEAMHAVWSNVPRLDQVFWQTVRTQHPPMLLLVERYVLALGNSEVLLRAPSVLLNTAACGLAYSWIRRVWGVRAGVAALTFLLFCPGMTSAGTEIRQLGFLVFFVCAALAAFERGIDDASAWWIAVYGVALGLSLGSHYATGMILIALGLAAPVRLWQAGSPRRLWAAWATGQLALLAACYGVYQWHLGQQLDRGQQSFLSTALYTSGGAHTFLARSWTDVWDYLAGPTPWGGALMVAFVVGLFAPSDARKRIGAWMTVLLPCVVASILAMRGTYPLGGTRHVQFLLPFLAAGVGAGIAWAWRGTTRQACAALIVVVPLWVVSAEPDNGRAPVERHFLAQALTFLDRDVPTDAPVIIDEQTFYMLRRYRGERQDPALNAPGFTREIIGARPFLVAHRSWVFSAQSLAPMLSDLKKSGLASEGCWVISTGWYHMPSWQNALPPAQTLRYVEFGSMRFVKVNLAAG